MNDYVDVDDETAARIDMSFDDMYTFLRSLIDDPAPLQLIPDGSILEFRTVRRGDEVMQLTAYRASESNDPWTARVTSCGLADVSHEDEVVCETSNGSLPPYLSRRCPEPHDEVIRLAASAEAALDALEAAVLAHAMPVAGRP